MIDVPHRYKHTGPASCVFRKLWVRRLEQDLDSVEGSDDSFGLGVRVSLARNSQFALRICNGIRHDRKQRRAEAMIKLYSLHILPDHLRNHCARHNLNSSCPGTWARRERDRHPFVSPPRVCFLRMCVVLKTSTKRMFGIMVVPRAISRDLGFPSRMVVWVVMSLLHGLKLEEAFTGRLIQKKHIVRRYERRTRGEGV